MQRNRLKSLLNMEYSPRELAEEVGFRVSQVYRVYLPLGCPNHRDEVRRYWINGAAFRAWYGEVYKKVGLAEGEAFCLTCKKAVPLVDPERKVKGGLIFDECECSECGRTLARIVGPSK